MKYLTYPINISIPVETFHALTDACGEGYYGDVAETVVNDLILQWLAHQGNRGADAAATAEVPALKAQRSSAMAHQQRPLALPTRMAAAAAMPGKPSGCNSLVSAAGRWPAAGVKKKKREPKLPLPTYMM